jgi:radical SAM superfamily enzyme YgiQ (UPF0313 family)
MSSLDILLVNPNSRSDVFGQNKHLPVGLGYIARALEVNNFVYEIADLNFQEPREAYKIIERKKPKYLGISMMSYLVDDAYRFLEEAKKIAPSMQVIAGGPHVIAFGQSIFDECGAIGIACVGEGEEAIIELLRGDPLSKIKGIHYRQDNKIYTTESGGSRLI